MLKIGDYSFPFFDIGISMFGLLFTLLLVVSPPIIHQSLSWRKPLIGSVFILICTLGILATLLPKRCSQAFHFQRGTSSLALSRIRIASHHPDCGKFSAHVLRIDGHTFCAACTGLLSGGIISILGALVYFLVGWPFVLAPFAVALIGITAVFLGFFQLKFRGILRSVLNAFFVFGALLILVGVDELSGGLFVDFLLESFIAFWIFTRIQLSQWDHQRICKNCEFHCNIGEEKKSRS
jgi:hypothetical protein